MLELRLLLWVHVAATRVRRSCDDRLQHALFEAADALLVLSLRLDSNWGDWRVKGGAWRIGYPR